MEHVYVSYNNQPVLADFCIELPHHGIVGLTGRSGCGKTTFLHLLAGLIRPDSGSVTGLVGKSIGVVFQEDRLLPWLTAAENLDIITKNRVLTDTWLSKVHLSEQVNYYPSQMSGGMKRRIALARAFSFDCHLLLLDEPFSGLDQVLKNNLSELVKEQAARIPVVMVSHNSMELSELSDQLYLASGVPTMLKRVK